MGLVGAELIFYPKYKKRLIPMEPILFDLWIIGRNFYVVVTFFE